MTYNLLQYNTITDFKYSRKETYDLKAVDGKFSLIVIYLFLQLEFHFLPCVFYSNNKICCSRKPIY